MDRYGISSIVENFDIVLFDTVSLIYNLGRVRIHSFQLIPPFI